jgi:hypothetical protein
MGILAENIQESSSLVKIITGIKSETIFKVLPCVVEQFQLQSWLLQVIKSGLTKNPRPSINGCLI